MILVISDDFSGAAELAGIAMDAGLEVEIQTKPQVETTADVVILDTNTRSKTRERATVTMKRVAKNIKRYEFELIYKKVDSVLRGHVGMELSLLLDNSPGRSVLLVPANPSMGRTISNGIYLIDGHPLHQTVFASDPEFPVHTSDVVALAGAGSGSEHGTEIKRLQGRSAIPGQTGNVYLPDTQYGDDIRYWAENLDSHLIPAGAADFWRALLRSMGFYPRKKSGPPFDTEHQDRLFVCGSSLSKVEMMLEKLSVRELEQVQLKVGQPGRNEANITEAVAKQVIAKFGSTNSVVLSAEVTGNEAVLAEKIPGMLADVTAAVLKRVALRDIVVEGGTTASEVVRALGCSRFKPTNHFARGVIRMQPAGDNSPGPSVTVKPGSYSWPAALWP
ncbi:four-carbon acid sugar kinase family protein [Halalkalibaculum sp. DA3122]|uniref:four-carbon acid sugar kinase family protein n=1 Tax=Halalkalibaculum sp. DA3122 TaxID=3373607 RepID=UPI003754771B